jgi:hypothetical protein
MLARESFSTVSAPGPFLIPPFLAAGSKDGQRLATTFAMPAGTILFVNGGAGWRATTFGQYEATLLGLGFDAQGHLHGLQFLGADAPGSPGQVYYGSFDEVP